MSPGSNTKHNGRSKSVVLGVLLVVVAIVAVVLGRFVLPNTDLRSLNPLAGFSTTQVSGVVGSEKAGFFRDPDVEKRFRQLGYEVNVTTAGSREIAEQTDLSQYDFASPSSGPATEKVERQSADYTASYPFYSPMGVATFQPIVEILKREGLVREDNGMQVLDVAGFTELAMSDTRWRDLGQEFPSPRTVQISTTDIRTSNSAAMYLSILYWVFTNENPELASNNDELVRQITPFFAGQGYTASSSAGPFADYLSQGMGAAPMVMVYEAQFLGEQMSPNSRIDDSHVLLYLDPTVQANHGVVGMNEAGSEVGRLLTEDAELQELAARHGFRPSNSDIFSEVMGEHGLTPPVDYVASVDLPSYDQLELLITEVGKAYTTPPRDDPETTTPETTETN